MKTSSLKKGDNIHIDYSDLKKASSSPLCTDKAMQPDVYLLIYPAQRLRVYIED